MRIASLAILLLAACNAAAPAPAAVPAGEPATEPVTAAATEPVTAAATEPAAVTVPAPAPVPELPADMRVIAQARGGGVLITVSRPGHAVALVQGKERAFGMNQASLAVDTKKPVIWETTGRATLDVLRGEVTAEGAKGSARPTASLRVTEIPALVGEDEAGRHACHAHNGATAGFTVVCRVESFGANAVRLLGDTPQSRIQRIEDETTFVRIELDPAEREVDAAILAYASGGRGYVVRAEASALPGEPRPLLALLSAERTQPQPIPRRFPPHHPPHFDDMLF
jgi:hypothetical protein